MVNTPQTEPCAWEQKTGLREETTYVAIYPARLHAETWMNEAQDRGQSRSRYLIELIQEARANREGQLSTRDSEAARVEELEGTIDQLEHELAEQRNAPTAAPSLSSVVDVASHLTPQYRSLDAVVDAVLGAEALRDRVASGC